MVQLCRPKPAADVQCQCPRESARNGLLQAMRPRVLQVATKAGQLRLDGFELPRRALDGALADVLSLPSGERLAQVGHNA